MHPVLTSLHRSTERRLPGSGKLLKLGLLLDHADAAKKLSVDDIEKYIMADVLRRLRQDEIFYFGKRHRPQPTPDVSAPTIVVNKPLVAPVSVSTTITAAQLNTTDPDNTAAQLTYTISTPPQFGRLNRTSFTQADINSNAISYTVPSGSAATADLFAFTVADVAGNKTGGNFVIAIVEGMNVPPAMDNIFRAFQAFGVTDVATIFPMDGNDQYGDCVMACAAHGVTMWRAMVGAKDVVPAQDVIDTYFKLTGGPDVGLNPDSVMQWAMTNGLFGDAVQGYVDISTGNLQHLKDAIDLFGGCWFAFNVQSGYDVSWENRTPWVPGTYINAGHAVYMTGYDDKATYTDPSGKLYTGMFNLLTWGGTQLGAYDWAIAQGRVGIAIVPADADAVTWDGLDINTIMADLQQVKN